MQLHSLLLAFATLAQGAHQKRASNLSNRQSDTNVTGEVRAHEFLNEESDNLFSV